MGNRKRSTRERKAIVQWAAVSVCVLLFAVWGNMRSAAAAANTTEQCLAVLDEIGAQEAEKFINLEHLNITPEQYETIKAFTLSLTEPIEGKHDKIKAVYDWVKSSKTADVGEPCPADLEENDPYRVFKEKTGVCQGMANLCKAMLTALDVPVVIAHGYAGWEGHAWDFAFLEDHWGIVDASMQYFEMKNPSLISSFYDTRGLESVLYTENGFEFTFYEGGLSVVGYVGTETDVTLPDTCMGKAVTGVDSGNWPYRVHPFGKSEIRKMYLPQSITNGVLVEVPGGYEEIIAFSSEALEAIEVEAENPVFASWKGILYDKKYERMLSVPRGIKEAELRPQAALDKNTLYGLGKLETLRIADGTQRIEAYAIESCPELKKVYIPDSVTEIADEAFAKCGTDMTVYASEGSAGARFAQKNGLLLKTSEEPEETEPGGTETKPGGTGTTPGGAGSGQTNPEQPVVQIPKVKGVKVSYPKSGKAVIRWKKLKSVSGYELYKYQNKQWKKVKKIGKKVKISVKRNAKKACYYKMRAYKKIGKNLYYGAYSKKIKIKKKK